MICFRRLVLAAVAGGILTLGTAAEASGIIYNNLSSTSFGSDPVSVDGPLFNSFSTGSSASLLTDVKMKLSGIPTTPGSPQFTVSLLSDASTSPGSVLTTLGTFDDSSLSETAYTYDISVASYALTADTRYWIELSGPSSSVAWNYASDATGVGAAAEYWAYSPSGKIVVTPNSTPGPYQMEVTTTAASSVPEPGTLYQTLSALGIGLIAVMRRRMICA